MPLVIFKRESSNYPFSRYRFSDEITEGSNTYLDISYLPEIDAQTTDRYYTVQSAEDSRLDVLAQKFYRRVDLWWVIAHANQIVDPFSVPAGTLLRIPSLGSLHSTNGVLL